MSNLLYLGIAAVITTVGCVWLWYRNRKPTSLQSGIEEFQRELRALAPDRDRGHPDSDRDHSERDHDDSDQRERRSG